MPSMSCRPFTLTRFIAANWLERGELRVHEGDAHADARRMARGRWTVEVLQVQWEAVTGLERQPRVLATYGEVPEG